MKFYSIRQKKPIEVPESNINYKTTKNGRKLAVGEYQGESLYKFVKK